MRRCTLPFCLLTTALGACSGSTPSAQEPAPESSASAAGSTLAAADAGSTAATPPAKPREPVPSPSGSSAVGAEGAPQAAHTAPEPDTATADPSATRGVRTLFVYDKRVDCEGAMPMRCLLVREREDDEWTYFYSTIEGFEYEESYRYELRVAVESVPNPPMDAPSRRYRLLEVVSKQPASQKSSAP